MSKHWIVVADNSSARIFTTDDPQGGLQQIGSLEHPEGREHARDINADRPGRSFDSKGEGRHSMGVSVDPVEQELIRFAKQVGEHLKTACQDGRCNRLLLVAGPHLLGHLRQHIDLPADVQVTELEKNLGQYTAHEIRGHLPDRL
ncbi:MAG: host attachment protein [Gammaproteobacteria bacterium]